MKCEDINNRFSHMGILFTEKNEFGRGWLPLASWPDPQKVQEIKMLISLEKSSLYVYIHNIQIYTQILYIYSYIISYVYMIYELFCIFIYVYMNYLYIYTSTYTQIISKCAEKCYFIRAFWNLLQKESKLY